MEGVRTPIDKNAREISIRDVLLQLQEWIQFLWKKKLWIIVAGILGATSGFLISILSKPQYEAELTFVMEDKDANPLGAYMGFASQLGIDLGGGSSGVFNGENVMEFLKSRFIIEKSLLSSANVDGKTISLAEFYIQINHLREKWEKKPALANIQFLPNVNRSSFTRVQDSVLNTFQQALLKNALVVEKPDKKLSFISVKCVTTSELFSKFFTEQLVKEALRFYIDTKTQRSKANVDRLQAQADSMELQLNKKAYAVAVSQDINLNPARQVASTGTEVAMRDKMMLQTMYGEIVKNLEVSKISMAQEAPVIQIVDTPILPLKLLKLGKAKGIILGGLLGGIFIAFVLLGIKLYNHIIEPDLY